ncbi:MAG: complex I NDUFA9 subunit family protein [Anaerolineales bacterium]
MSERPQEAEMIVITGAAGYVGSHITKRLVQENKPVRALVHNRKRAEQEGRLADLDIEWTEADVTKPETLVPALKDADTVVHTVAIAIEKGNLTYEEINYQGTVNILEAAKKNGIRRFINMSQLGADPNLPYRFLASKGKAQHYVANSGMDWTAFRPSVIWGPEDEFANVFARLVPFSPIIYPIVGDESSKFQPVWVEDVATCVARSLNDPDTIGKEYELGGPEVLTLEEIERRTLKAIGAQRSMVPFPMPVLRVIVALMEALLPNPPVTRSLLELLAVSNVTEDNAISRFVSDPRAFTAENTSAYMQGFTARETLAKFLGK